MIKTENTQVITVYDPLGRCQYPVFAPGTPELEDDCGEPAIYKATWFTYEDGKEYRHGSMLVCPEHFEVVKQEELS